MGRFETTAATYAARREPYPPEFFAAAAKALDLKGTEALIDLGTGPGLLALGFAPYVARVVGVDPEPAMLAQAERAAAEAGIAFPLVPGRAEDVGPDLGRFDLITIGRALHWMDREAALAAFERMLAPGGRVLICGAKSSGLNPWRTDLERVYRGASSGGEAAHRRLHEHFFDGTRFARVADVEVEHRHRISAEALVERALTRSTTSRAVLGERVEAFKAELRAALAPYFGEGDGEEIIEAKARIFVAAAQPRGVGQVSESR